MKQHGDMELMMDVEGGAILRGLHTLYILTVKAQMQKLLENTGR